MPHKRVKFRIHTSHKHYIESLKDKTRDAKTHPLDILSQKQKVKVDKVSVS